MWVASKFIEVCFLTWERTRAYKLYEPVIVDQDAVGVDVAYLLVILLEFRAGSHHRIEQIP